MLPRFKHFKIRYKLFTLSGVMMLLFLLVSLYALKSLREESNIIENIYNKNLAAESSLKNLRYGTQKVVQTGLDLVAGNIGVDDARIMYQKYGTGDSSHASLFDEWAKYQHAFTEGEAFLTEETLVHQAEQYEVFQSKMEPFLTAFQQAKEAFEQGDDSQISAMINTPVIQMMIGRNMMEEPFDNLVSLEEYKVEAQYEHSKALFQQTLVIMITVIAISLLFCLVLTLYITRLILKPVKALNGSMGKVVGGDLTQSVAVLSRDEIGQMSDAFNNMIGQIKDALDRAELERCEAEAQKATAEEQRKLRQEVDEQRIYLKASVDDMLREMDKFASGDLSVSLTKKKDDEIGRLFDGFNRIVSTTHKTIKQVARGAENSSRSTVEILEAARQLAVGTEQLSEQTLKVVGAIEHMFSKIQVNAASANQAAETANQNASLAEDGGDIVRNTIEKIHLIANVVSESTTTVEQLGTSTSRIGEITGVIKDIAEQTNLLALNAAIEAARAGESGRGFAVVADEVRKLAERTSAATEEITVLLNTFLRDTRDAVVSMEKGRDEVQQGIKFAAKASKALKEIIEGTTLIGGLINQIAGADHEISEMSNEVNSNLGDISTLTTRAARGVSDIVSAVNTLNEDADQLNSMLSQFSYDPVHVD